MTPRLELLFHALLACSVIAAFGLIIVFAGKDWTR